MFPEVLAPGWGGGLWWWGVQSMSPESTENWAEGSGPGWCSVTYWHPQSWEAKCGVRNGDGLCGALTGTDFLFSLP